MNLIRHCIIDKENNIVVNVVEYNNLQTGVPPRLEANLFCVQSDTGLIGGVYANGVITNPIPAKNPIPSFPTPLLDEVKALVG